MSRWYVRMAVKCLVFAVVTFLVLFPNPGQFVRHLSHLHDLNAMVEPDAPELAPWEQQIRRQFAEAQEGRAAIAASDDLSQADPLAVQAAVEQFVYKNVKYSWDWDVWGSADYMPTVGEMFAWGAKTEDGVIREDCDGRAVMAASLMRRLGYESSIVTDLRHVWVVTERGEWMGPGRAKTIKSSAKGNQTNISTALSNVPASFAFGVAVFPFWREMIIVTTAFILLFHRRVSGRRALIAAVLMLQGLLFMRAYTPAISGPGISQDWTAWVGVLHMVAGLGVLIVSSSRARRMARLHG